LPPPIFWKLSGLQDSYVERCPSPKLAANAFFYLKNSVKNGTKNVKTRIIANILKRLETSQNPQNFSLRRYV